MSLEGHKENNGMDSNLTLMPFHYLFHAPCFLRGGTSHGKFKEIVVRRVLYTKMRVNVRSRDALFSFACQAQLACFLCALGGFDLSMLIGPFPKYSIGI